jgi:hypothetical protein
MDLANGVRGLSSHGTEAAVESLGATMAGSVFESLLRGLDGLAGHTHDARCLSHPGAITIVKLPKAQTAAKCFDIPGGNIVLGSAWFCWRRRFLCIRRLPRSTIYYLSKYTLRSSRIRPRRHAACVASSAEDCQCTN